VFDDEDAREAQADLQPEHDQHAARQRPQRVMQLVAHGLVVDQHREQRQREQEGVDQQAGQQHLADVSAVGAQEVPERVFHTHSLSVPGAAAPEVSGNQRQDMKKQLQRTRAPQGCSSTALR
jgi:hypothetical protein